MKSIFLSFLILGFLFVFVNFGILSIFGSKTFHYSAVILFVLVIASACYFVGIKEETNIPENQDTEQPKEGQTNEEQM